MKSHPKYYSFSMGHELGDYWVHGEVRARSAEKAFKKAQRIQKQKGWPFLSLKDEDQISLGRIPNWRKNKKLLNRAHLRPQALSGPRTRTADGE